MNNGKTGMGLAAAVGFIVILVAAPFLFLFALIMDEDSSAAVTAATTRCDADAVLADVKVGELPTKQVGQYKAAQLENAAVISNEAKSRDLGRAGAVIGVMTSIVESGLRNVANDGSFTYPSGSGVMTQKEWKAAKSEAITSMDLPHQGTGSDWDSVGLFQQRPSAGWGKVKDLMNPSYSAGKFFTTLEDVKGWEKKSYGEAAQAVQRSAFPDRYNQVRSDAESVVDAIQGVKVTNAETVADSSAANCGDDQGFTGTVSADGWVLPMKEYTSMPGAGGFGNPRGAYPHAGQDFSAPQGTPIYAAADGKVTRAGCDDLVVGRSPCQVQIDHGTQDGQQISTLYVHMYPKDVLAKVGQNVKAGDLIAKVGSNGNSTGPHLHLEVWEGKDPTNPVPWLTSHGVKLHP